MRAILTPLDPALPLADVLCHAAPGTLLGVWIEIAALPRPLALRVPASPRWISLLLSPDLAGLVVRAPHVLVARAGVPWVAPSERLRDGRRLEIVSEGAPMLHPLDGISPEAIVAERRSAVRVDSTRIRYLQPG